MEIEKIIDLLTKVHAGLWSELIKAARIQAIIELGIGSIMFGFGVVAMIFAILENHDIKDDHDPSPLWFLLAIIGIFIGIFALVIGFYNLNTLEYQAYKMLISP